MSWYNGILSWFDGRMTTPNAYGWYHIMCLIITLVLSIALAVGFRNSTNKQHRIILFVIATICLCLEIYKQINFSYSPSTDTWDYQWYAFPFQFCSTPMYIALIASFIKNEKVQSYFNAFLGTFCLFAGLSVMLYHGDVFTSTIGINLQTMIHHGLMVVVGVYCLASNKCKLEHKSILKAMVVFGVLVAMAFIMDIIAPNVISETFNMFYISPTYGCHLPILSQVFSSVPYPVFLIIYIFGFSLCAYIMLLVAISIKFLVKVTHKK